MSSMNDIIRLPKDLGNAVKRARKDIGIKAIAIARHSGRSRDILNRLERGEDITVSSLMDILAAMGLALRLERAGLPTLDEMTARFSDLDDEDDAP
ncbi:MAG: transcriptional regulator [Comamonadaceae bacterium]|nr:transcriptional regulator [Comamonadaceae bacterium]